MGGGKGDFCMCLCKHVKHLSVLCSFTAVVSAHPIHSLDNPHHHFHSSSLASPARSHLHHPSSPWPIGTSMSLSDRANSTGERWGSSPDVERIPKLASGNGEGLAVYRNCQCYLFIIHFCDGFRFVFCKIYCIFLLKFKYSVQGVILVKSSSNLNWVSSSSNKSCTFVPFCNFIFFLFLPFEREVYPEWLLGTSGCLCLSHSDVRGVCKTVIRCRLLPYGPE